MTTVLVWVAIQGALAGSYTRHGGAIGHVHELTVDQQTARAAGQRGTTGRPSRGQRRTAHGRDLSSVQA
jgi:hypothetical protein